MTDQAITQPESPTNGDETKTATGRTRSPLTKVLPTDRILFDSQVELLRAFATVYASNGGNPVTNEQAGDVLTRKLSGSTVSQSNGFFTDIGLLSRADKGGFVPSTEVIEYNNACQWDEAEARLQLRSVFEKTWFYRCLVPRLQLAPQPQATCLALLAAESKASPEHNDRLVNLLNFLALAGVVSTTGGTVTLLQRKLSSTDKITQPIAPPVKGPKEFTDQEEHSLFLDKEKQRRFSISGPLFISRAEYSRICKWIEVTLIVEDAGTEHDK